MRSLSFGFMALVLCASCKKTAMDRVGEIRDQLSGDDAPRWNGDLAQCNGPARGSCAKDVATSMGGTFDDKKPDQVSAAAVAVVVARSHRGSDVGSPDVWLTAMRKATGPGADALRLATALAMKQLADKHAHLIETDEAARAFVGDVATAIAGACPTYEALGAGASPDAMPPADSPDHSACVQHDLARKEGPGPTYGQGLFRAAAAALALWKDTLAALHDGVAQTDDRSKKTLERRIAVLDAATPKINLKVVAAPAGNTWGQMIEEHNTPLGSDAGPPLKK